MVVAASPEAGALTWRSLTAPSGEAGNCDIAVIQTNGCPASNSAERRWQIGLGRWADGPASDIVLRATKCPGRSGALKAAGIRSSAPGWLPTASEISTDKLVKFVQAAGKGNGDCQSAARAAIHSPKMSASITSGCPRRGMRSVPRRITLTMRLPCALWSRLLQGGRGARSYPISAPSRPASGYTPAQPGGRP